MMPRTRVPLLTTACALAILLFASPAQAQPPGGGFGGPRLRRPRRLRWPWVRWPRRLRWPGGFGGPGFGGPGGFGGPFGGQGVSSLLTLAQDSAVWDEIKITDEQLGKVTRIRSSIDKQSRQLRDGMRAQMMALARPEERTDSPSTPPWRPPRGIRPGRRRGRRWRRIPPRCSSDSEAALKKILKATQFTRLQQIDLQQQGPLVVVRPDVAKALNLSSDQLERAQLAITQMTDQGREQMTKSQHRVL